jgi:hypothetical protein
MKENDIPLDSDMLDKAMDSDCTSGILMNRSTLFHIIVDFIKADRKRKDRPISGNPHDLPGTDILLKGDEDNPGINGLINELHPGVDGIFRCNVTTKAKNTLQLFYNPTNDLVVIDLIHRNEKGGTELLRKTLNEKSMLKHIKYNT